VLAEVVQLHDVRVLQRRDGFGLGQEAGEVVRPGVAAGQHHLQSHHPVQLQVAGLVNDAHAAPAQLPQDLVAGYHGPGRGRRLWALLRPGGKPGTDRVRRRGGWERLPRAGVQEGLHGLHCPEVVSQPLHQVRAGGAQFLGRDVLPPRPQLAPAAEQVAHEALVDRADGLRVRLRAPAFCRRWPAGRLRSPPGWQGAGLGAVDRRRRGRRQRLRVGRGSVRSGARRVVFRRGGGHGVRPRRRWAPSLVRYGASASGQRLLDYAKLAAGRKAPTGRLLHDSVEAFRLSLRARWCRPAMNPRGRAEGLAALARPRQPVAPPTTATLPTPPCRVTIRCSSGAAGSGRNPGATRRRCE
jgi:hypothetical protein